MKTLKWLFNEIFLFFRDPREIHRVLLVIPLSALATHILFIYNSIPDTHLYTQPEQTAIALGVFVYTVLIGICFLSNEMTFDLLGRFSIICGWSVLGDMIVIGDEVFGNASLFFICFAFFGLSILLIWALTGLKYEHFKAKYIEPRLRKFDIKFGKNEKKSNVVAMSDRDNAINE